MISFMLITVLTIVGQFQVTAKGLSLVERNTSPCFNSPCKNNGRCSIAGEGYYCQCPEDYSGKDCEKIKDKTSRIKCTDSDPDQCPHWANNGECFNNPAWMLQNCKKSCRAAGCGCIEENKSCVAWAKRGECQKNPVYMLRFCRRSCGGCKQSGEPGVLY